MSRNVAIKTGLFLLVLVAGAIGYWLLGDQLSIESLSAREAELRGWREGNPLLAVAGAFLIYVAVTGLSLPGATALSIVYAWFFGLWTGFVLVSFASTTGATVAFLLSRYFFRQWIESRFGARLTQVNGNLERDGAFYLFTLRLIPQIPFFVINVVMGLTRMKVRTFWWVSQLGMLAGTFVFVYVGSTIDLNKFARDGFSGILSPGLMVALIMLGIFPLATRKLITMLRSSKSGTPEIRSGTDS